MVSFIFSKNFACVANFFFLIPCWRAEKNFQGIKIFSGHKKKGPKSFRD
jgi:hypothetical protein